MNVNVMSSVSPSDAAVLPASAPDDVLATDKLQRILLVDDHPVVRQGIRNILLGAFPHVEIGEAGDATGALHEITHREWDVVILDISLPGASGLDTLRTIRRDDPELPVLILSMHPADQFAQECIGAGAAGYLTKHSGPQQLIQAVKTVVSGSVYTEPDKYPAPFRVDRSRLRHERLSDREYQVLRMLAQGRTVSQIASELVLSVKTVSTYRSRVLEKMSMRTTAELIRYAIMNRLVD